MVRRNAVHLLVGMVLLTGVAVERAPAACLGEGRGDLAPLEELAFRDPAGAIPAVEQRLEADRRSPALTHEQRATLFAIEGESYWQTDRVLESLVAANRGLAELPASGMTALAFRLRSLRGMTLDLNGATPLALLELDQTIDAARGNARADACVRRDRGYVLSGTPAMARSLQDLTIAYRYLKEHGPLGEAMDAAGRLASEFREARDFSSAHALIAESIAYFSGTKDWLRLATAHEQLGMILQFEHRPREALAEFADVARLSEFAHDVGGLAYSKLRSCESRTELGDVAEAEKDCASAEQLLGSLGPIQPSDTENFEWVRGEIALRRRDPAAAVTHFTTALGIGSSDADDDFGATIYLARSEAYFALGDYARALADRHVYDERLDVLRAAQRAQAIAIEHASLDMEREIEKNAALERERRALVERSERERNERMMIIAESILALGATLVLMLLMQRRRVADTARMAAERRIAELGRLTTGVAHDFNNLMTVIQQAAGLLAQHRALREDAESISLLDAIQKAAKTGGGITGQLLAFGRQQNLKPETIICAEFLAAKRTLLQRVAGESIALVIEPIDPALRIRADRALLTSALVNLVVNSREAMLDGGTILIRTRRDSESADRIGIVVNDDGAGMSADVLRRATEPFYSTKQYGSNSGLGLSAVQGFATQSGGQLEVSSIEGVGTTICLWLPADRAA